jgi:RNA polymerase sigma-70 factor (ECF subfamily)
MSGSSTTTPFPLDLTARLHAQETTAWRLAFNRLWPVAMRSASYLLKDRTEIEDAAAAALGDLTHQSKLPESWAALEALTAVIARRRAISLLRARTAAKRSSDETISLEQIANEIPAADIAGAALDLDTLLERLGDPRRQIIIEHFLHGRTSEEIGRRLDLKPGTVRSHLFRALQELRSWLGDQFR